MLNGQATVTPKAGTGPVEAVRQLRIARSGAMKARTAAANQLHSLCDTAPDSIRAQLAGLTLKKKVAIAERWRPGSTMTVETAARRSLSTVACRWRSLDDEARELSRHVKAILDDVAPGQLLISDGDNPGRLRHEKSFAALCGASPVQASSGRTTRHRLNRGAVGLTGRTGRIGRCRDPGSVPACWA